MKGSAALVKCLLLRHIWAPSAQWVVPRGSIAMMRTLWRSALPTLATIKLGKIKGIFGSVTPSPPWTRRAFQSEETWYVELARTKLYQVSSYHRKQGVYCKGPFLEVAVIWLTFCWSAFLMGPLLPTTSRKPVKIAYIESKCWIWIWYLRWHPTQCFILFQKALMS